ncbi:hypothetical protein VC83_04842 [Pseudogymnoascus destructans]|uniref:Fanconi-associated nuclease n=2 Tax=Pseudogymnoascus destructans TaxID=655981 RepID=L8G2E3_PSED2|nr:uncharacterized protein VC83_04842 [Pseudogymnoascus destructans]ELR06858.1 hypothetical protein GMDG_08149 [Pseudogymnoascus destructans 20631-21]OAF57394.1 hypothetical protein VC83_04842 [Pseudogymnoascus destructans]
MAAIDERDNGYPVKRRKTGEQVETLKQETPPVASNAFENARLDLDLNTFGTDTDGPTELESALPHLDQGKDAIVDYEAIQPFEKDIDGSEDLEDNLSTRKLPIGRRSIYVNAFNLALETVLDEESHLFDKKEGKVFDEWHGLSYEAQYLYVRLFLRKTSAWHRAYRLGYHSDISYIDAAIESLQSSRPLPQVPGEMPVTSVKIEDSGFHLESNSFAFADALTEDTTLEEVSSLLSLDELKSIGKEAKVRGKNKTELLSALRRMSRAQSGLGSVGLRILKSKSDPEIVSSGPKISDVPHISTAVSGETHLDESGTHSNVNVKLSDQTFSESNRDKHFVRKILGNIGSCIRLSSSTLGLFERVHMVYYRSTRWTEKSLTTIILARIQRRNFPNYLICRSANIFPSRALLLEFEASIRLQHQVDSILENGIQDKQVQGEMLSIFEEVYPKWQALVADEQHKEERVYESGEGAYLRLFSPCSVYTRIISKATLVFGRLKMYEREHSVLTKLLEQRLFIYRRGGIYQRKALIEEHYLAEAGAGSTGTAGMSQDQLKRYWKRSSLKTAEEGLQDRDCHVIYHYDLEKRIIKLEKAIKIPKREQHDFGHTRLITPIERNVEGIQVRVIPADVGRAGAEERRSFKTIWVDEKDGGGECSVEAMCLSWYRSQGWKGYHAEGGILQTLFAYLFYDILFAYIPNVFQTEFQTCPLDLYTEAFFPSRASEIHHRLAELSNGGAGRLIREVNERERERRTCVVGLNWDFAVDDLLEIAACFDGSALASICMVMAQDYRQRGGGVPDLFLWNPETSQVMLSEVKSENDRLSDTQRLWIHVLMGSGVKVELCNAVAGEVRTREE